MGDWSIFRREDVFFGSTVGRKHGPVPFARQNGYGGSQPLARKPQYSDVGNKGKFFRRLLQGMQVLLSACFVDLRQGTRLGFEKLDEL